MKKTLTVLIIVISGLVISALLFGAGMMFGRTNGWRMQGTPEYGYGMMGNSGYGMMGNSGYGMMGNSGYGMMGNSGYGMMGNSGYGMMGNSGYGMMGNSGYGMMGGNWSENNPDVEPITMKQAEQAVEKYLSTYFDSDLEIAEIMIFNNNGYAIVVEKSTGIGAMELLIDPTNLDVFPEFGPNMMWNLKYGSMGTRGMMGNSFNRTYDNEINMSISKEEASDIAQSYLNDQFPGYQVSEDITTFYGYYTIDILKDGSPTGMLSINGFNGQVFLHTWHGTFIEMSE
jgi:hypothetical protein